MNFEGISRQQIEEYDSKFTSNPLYRALGNALTYSNVKSASCSFKGKNASRFLFSTEVSMPPVADQGKTGYCWLYAALAILRKVTGDRLSQSDFRFSPSYVAFWDKLEKANFFLDIVVDRADKPLSDQFLQSILARGVQDNGNWSSFVNLVEKYGLVPWHAMSGTSQSYDTAKMNRLLNARLRRGAGQLRQTAADGGDVRALKREILGEVYSLLRLCYGEPPKAFDFEYVSYAGDKREVRAHRGLTPLEFYARYVGVDLRGHYALLGNYPTADTPFYRTFCSPFSDNVIGDGCKTIPTLNLPMDEMKGLIVAQLKDGQPVWVTCDADNYKYSTTAAAWSEACFDYDGTFGMEFGISKGDSLDLRDSRPNHNVILRGVNAGADGTPDRWLAQNSWGADSGNSGHVMMDAGWFDRYVYEAVIDKKFLSEKLLADLDAKPIYVSPGSPMGMPSD